MIGHSQMPLSGSSPLHFLMLHSEDRPLWLLQRRPFRLSSVDASWGDIVSEIRTGVAPFEAIRPPSQVDLPLSDETS